MGNEEKKRMGELAHSLSMTGRERLSVTGVTDVTTFDENTIAMETAEGTLRVRGEGLHVERLCLEQGELTLTGQVQSLEYDELTGARGGLLARLFG